MFTVGKRYAARASGAEEASDRAGTSDVEHANDVEGTNGTEQCAGREDSASREQTASRSNVGHPEPSMPVPCVQSAKDLESQAVGGSRTLIEGSGDQQSSRRSDAGEVGRAGVSTDDDSAARGWVIPPGGSKVDALFLVSTERLGIGRSESTDPPIWFDLTRVLKLDAIGEPDRGLLQVELVMDDDTVVAAGWPEAFCNKVVEALSATRSTPAPAGSDVPDHSGVPGSGLPKSDQSQPDQPQHSLSVEDHPESPFSAKPVVRRRSRNRRNGGENAAANSESAVEPSVTSQNTPAHDGSAQDGATQDGATQDGAGQIASVEPSDAPIVGEFAAVSGESNDESADKSGDKSGESDKGTGSESGNETSSAAVGEPTGELATDSAAAAPSSARSSTDPVDHARAAVGAARRNAALELEDVTYLGGLPGQTKRRKRCTATLTMDGFELKGPADLSVQMDWESVKSIETQNSDEARFRTNTKIHRDSSALVIACEDGLTLILEARDCPTVPLRAAISQLLGELSVEVV
ncbi:MAG: hypothetical protein WBA45_06855 [Microthrixaceae bacterium]